MYTYGQIEVVETDIFYDCTQTVDTLELSADDLEVVECVATATTVASAPRIDVYV